MLSITPGRLLKLGEDCQITSSTGTEVILRKRNGTGWSEIARKTVEADVPWHWKAADCGFYLAELGGGMGQRSIAIVNRDWSICQVTVGAGTAEDFADTIHPAGISADYYVHPTKQNTQEPFSMQDPRWLTYEQNFGDSIHPHVHAGDLVFLDPKFAHDNSNWDTLSLDAIKEQLHALQAWFARKGFAPLNRIASYTPSNMLVKACSEVGIRILHSLIPEQNWSDGEWSINHWGMPTCPFWIAEDDFRKAGVRRADAVLGMTMNHYHVTLPHLTHWGDFVLSPSHFDRWIRAADSGPHPVRFRQFLKDVVTGWDGVDGEPFFFVAGFEFGRTFGTTKMTRYNRQGLEALIELAGTEKLAFATSRDVLAYYERHITALPGRIFRQRDSWAGVTVNDKPALAGDSVVVEKAAYKSATLEGEALPYFYYDYAIPWKFDTRDQKAPADFASASRKELKVTRDSDVLLSLSAEKPLGRTIPVVIWDAEPESSGLSAMHLPALDDARTVVLLEIPKGWHGSAELKLRPAKKLATFQDRAGWKIQTFGVNETRHSYLIMDRPLIADVTLPITLKKSARLDSTQDSLGMQAAGTLNLTFGPLKQWYRFWNCDVTDIDPPRLEGRTDLPLLSDHWQVDVEKHESALHEAALRKLSTGKILLEVLCGGNLPLGSRSRAASVDRVILTHPGMEAHEYGDGAIAFGPGRSFWYHPRGLTFKIRASEADRKNGLTVLLNSFDPLALNASYRVQILSRDLGLWPLPASPLDDSAWFKVELKEEDFGPDGQAAITLGVNQVGVLDDWWKDRGFIAALHALWIEAA